MNLRNNNTARWYRQHSAPPVEAALLGPDTLQCPSWAATDHRCVALKPCWMGLPAPIETQHAAALARLTVGTRTPLRMFQGQQRHRESPVALHAPPNLLWYSTHLS